MAPTGTEPRERIVRAAARLLDDGGREAVTTRAVESVAGVQAPTIYRLFGDKRGLLDAVAAYRIDEYVAAKAAAAEGEEDRDPVEVLREAWRSNVQFGLDNPALFGLMYGDPRPGERSPAVTRGEEILRARVRRIAAAGRLKVSEQRAVELILATGRGAVLTLLSVPGDERDLGMLDALLDGLLTSIATAAPTTAAYDVPVAANALRAALAEGTSPLSPGEAALLDELLVRLSGSP